MTNYTGFISTPGNQAFTPDGLALLLLQVSIILVFCRGISIPFSYLNQPRVIAEVIGGILLGPTALGRWKWFNSTIFPTSSLGIQSVLSNFGLLMFLFLMGLELDLSVVAKRARTSLTISGTGIILTFCLSIGVSRFFYTYIPGISDLVDYPKLLIFIGVAMSVTAFPVLARILTERKLLKTPVGVSVISAAAVDDAVGWMALALVIAVIAASNPLTGVYIFACVIGFALFMFIVMRPLLARVHHYFLALRNQNANNDDVSISQPMVLIAFVVTIISSFYTSAVGIHSIFGAFITGLILPRDDGFAVKLTEKLEEMITVVLLPLYFTNSGLKTNIGAINSGISFGALFLVFATVCVGKIGGCTVAARLCGLNPRESVTVGVLMNTKGLVEIIILNIGLSSGLINDQIFAVMILLAILTTCMTTPVVMWIYPESYYNASGPKQPELEFAEQNGLDEPRRLLLCLPDTSSVSTMMGLIHHMTENRRADSTAAVSPGKLSPGAAAAVARAMAASDNTVIHVVRLRQLTDRMSALMLAASEDAANWVRDSSLMAFRTFGLLRGVNVTPHVLLAERKDYAKDIASLAYEKDCDTIILPWKIKKSVVELEEEEENVASPSTPKDLFASWFGNAASGAAPGSPVGEKIQLEVLESGKEPAAATKDVHTVTGNQNRSDVDAWVGEVANQLIKKAKVKIAVLVDRSADAVAQSEAEVFTVPPPASVSLRIETGHGLHHRRPSVARVVAAPHGPAKAVSFLVPFFGGPDDRAAVRLAVRLAASSEASLSILHMRQMQKVPDGIAANVKSIHSGGLRIFSTSGANGTTNTITNDLGIPDGYIVDPVDAEDEKTLSAALGFNIAEATVNVISTSSTIDSLARSEHDQETTSEISLTAIPHNRETSANQGSTLPPLPLVRSLTTQSMSLTPGGPRENTAASTNGSLPVRIVEAFSATPLETLIELLRASDLEAATGLPGDPSLVVLGHYGATWSSSFAAGDEAGYGTVNGATKWSATQGTVQGTWNTGPGAGQETVQSMASFRGSGVTGGALSGNVEKPVSVSVESQVLGPTATKLVNENVGTWDMLVVRKIRIDAWIKDT